MRKLACALGGWLPAEGGLGRVVAGHRGRCLHCQAAAVRSRSMSRELSLLSEDLVAAPAWLVDAVMTRLGSQDAANPRRSIVRHVVARYVAAGATAVTAAVVFAGLSRWRSRLPA